MRASRLPLSSLESRTRLREFDVVGFSLQYEMTATNVLEMLDLAGIPLRALDRGEDDPLIAAGGPVVFNVEPLADFLDLVFIGDGEELIGEFLDLLRTLKRRGAKRQEQLEAAAALEGIYVPALYDAPVDPRSGLRIPVPRDGAPYPVRRRILFDLDRFPFPEKIIVPHGEIVHDRVSVEIMRGCPVGCRFCQAGYVYRPRRERDPHQVRDTVVRSVQATGYDQFSLSSLNTGVYGSIHALIGNLMERFEPRHTSISLSSMHASTITPALAAQLRRVRKGGFTIAPEAGTQRLRHVINKNLTEEQILDACRLAFEAGWEQIKLYFMIGLPTETDTDVDAMVDMAHRIASAARRRGRRRRKDRVILSVSSFIPKPETPFQWIGMERVEELERKQARIAARTGGGVRFKRHGSQTSFLEAVFSRGDRALGSVLELAWRKGARFDGWEEQLDLPAWQAAFREAEIDPHAYAHADLDPEGPLPWDVIDSRVNRGWLAQELKRALEAGTLSVCGPRDCHGCASFARECVQGVVAQTTGRLLEKAPAVPVEPEAPRAAALRGAEEIAQGDAAAEAPRPHEPPRYRYRARFSKTGRLRFLGHLDLVRLLARGFRRAGIPLLYSQGFNPKPKLAFAPALPVGLASKAEYLDLESPRRLEPDEALARINRALPEGVRFSRLEQIRRDLPALGDAIREARYTVYLPDGIDAPGALAEYERRGRGFIQRAGGRGRTRTFDLAREILGLEPIDAGSIRIALAVRAGRASVRLDEVLREIFGEPAEGFEATREALLVDCNGRRVDPLLAARAAEFQPAVG